ncbi:hypothetical protein FRC19_001824 [Serendipita sp. 401]|nr:hypothetical protein FRC19_001824 [Serendipita sp. 401]
MHAKGSTAYERTSDWTVLFFNCLREISEASEMLAPLKSTSMLLIRGLETVRTMHNNRSAWEELARKLALHHTTINGYISQLEVGDRPSSNASQDALKKYAEVLSAILREATASADVAGTPNLKKTFKRIGDTQIEKDRIAELSRDADFAHRQFDEAMRIIMARQVTELQQQLDRVRAEIMQEIGELKSRNDLPDFDEPFLSLVRGQDLDICEQGTRSEILGQIRIWAIDEQIKSQIYWLNDAAGTGKTTIAATLADEWLTNRTLAGRFFFSPNSAATSSLDQFCSLLAKDIALQLPEVRQVINARIREVSAACLRFSQQFRRLVVEPLKLVSDKRNLLLVIDALDNCKGRDKLLSELLLHLPSISSVKLLLTSRPLPDITDILSTSTLIEGYNTCLLDVYNPSYADVTIYIRKRVPKLEGEYVDLIANRSGGLFIWAATVCRMLQIYRRPSKLLHQILDSQSFKGLDDLYLQVLEQALVDKAAHSLFMNILEAVTISFQPLSISSLQVLFPENDKVDLFIQDLCGVLKDGDPHRPIKVLHPTFREFLYQADRANGFLVRTTNAHALLSSSCVVLLLGVLKHNILGLSYQKSAIPTNTHIENVNDLVEQNTTVALKYASSYWARHAAASILESDVQEKVMTFLSTKLLNWLELMSFRGCVGQCIQGLAQLQTAVAMIENRSDLKQNAVSNSYQFALQNQSLMTEAALHLYTTPLAFLPKESFISERYQRAHKVLIPVVTSAASTKWSAHTVLTGHTGHIEQVAFALNYTRVVSRDTDNTLSLWDIESGSLIGKQSAGSVKGKQVAIKHFTVSPDGEEVAFVTKSNNIYVLSAITGALSGEPIDASAEEILHITFCPNRRRIITSSISSTMFNVLRLWDLEAQTTVGNPMRLDVPTTCMCLSPDGTMLVSVSIYGHCPGKGLVIAWSLEDYSQVVSYTMSRVGYMKCIRFCPDGSYFATWTRDGTIHLRLGHTGERMLELCSTRTNDPVDDVVISPSGRHIASYNFGGSTVYLWEVKSGLVLNHHTLVGHEMDIRYLLFSPEGDRVVSISLDQTVRVWNTHTGEGLQSFFTGYTGTIMLPELSQDWRYLLTVGLSNQINIYDVSHQCQGEEKPGDERSFAVPVIAFSPLGDIFACGFTEYVSKPYIQRWSVETTQPLGEPMTGHTNGVRCVAFTSDGQIIASGSDDCTVRLWSSSTGNALWTIPTEMNTVERIAFTFTGEVMVLGSNHKIYVINTKAKNVVWSTGKENSNSELVLSADNSKIAATCDNGVGIWDVLAGKQMARCDISGRIFHLSFHPQRDLLAICSYTCIYLWESNSGQIPSLELQIKYENGFQLGFTLDGKYLLYGDLVWNVQSKRPRKLGPGDIRVDLGSYEQSLIYRDGWIYYVATRGPLLPIPSHLREQFFDWTAFYNLILVWTQDKLPVLVDCTPFFH